MRKILEEYLKSEKDFSSFYEDYRKDIGSYFMESFISDMMDVMKSITKLFKEYDINFIFIGGVSRNLYNYRKTTEDVDILVSKYDKDKMKDLPIGFLKEISKGRLKVFKWHTPETRLEVIYSDEISGDGINGLKYPEPDKIRNMVAGLPIISLKKLIEFKLSSGEYGRRDKDFVDVQELIKANNLKLNYADDFRDDLKDLYRDMYNRAYRQLGI